MPEALRARVATSLCPSAVGLVLLGVLALGTLVGCQGSTEGRLMEIQAMQQAGEFAQTIEPLREIVASDPDHADANYLLGVALLKTGRSSQAIFPLQKAAASDKHAVTAGVILGATLFNTENFEQAVETATDVLETDPELTTALHMRARAYMAIGKPTEALADAERSLEIHPEDFKAHTLKAEALVDLERFEEAEAVYLRVEELAADLGDPDSEARACAALSQFYSMRDRDDEAVAEIQSCVERFPSHGTVLGVAAEHFDRNDEAEEGNAVWRRAIDELPDSLPLRTQLASRLEDQGRLEEAQEVLEETAELFDTAQAWYELVRLRRTMGDTEGALEAVERSIERTGGPSSESLRFLQADLLVQSGDLETAEEVIAQLDQREYRDVARAHLLLARDEPAQALALLEGVLALWPDNAGARHLAGRAAERVGDYDRALNQYREAYRADQEASDAALSMARIHLARGQIEEALGWATSDFRRRPAARTESTVLGARIASALGDAQRAREWLATAEKEGADPLTLAVERAWVARRAEGPEAAVAAIREAGLDLEDPANAPALASLVSDMVALGREDEAVARLEEATAAHPDAPALHDLQARLLLRVGRTQEARAAFERALEADETFAAARQGLGALALAQGDAQGALEQAQQALRGDPQQVDAAYTVAQAQLALGRTDEAIASLRRVAALEPGHPGASNDLAWLLAERGEDLQTARVLARVAVEQAPQAETWDTLGWVQLRAGDASAAVESFQRSLGLRESPSVRYRLGLALAEAGDADAARDAFEKALATGEFPESEAARSQLARLDSR